MNKQIGSMKDNLAYYLGLDYTIILRRDEDGDFVARIGELPGCTAHGSDAAQAISNVGAMQAAWIEACLDSGQSVPEP